MVGLKTRMIKKQFKQITMRMPDYDYKRSDKQTPQTIRSSSPVTHLIYPDVFRVPMIHMTAIIFDAVGCRNMLAIGQKMFYNHSSGVRPCVGRGGGNRFAAQSTIVNLGPNVEFIK
jgi:hypothetical protein